MKTNDPNLELFAEYRRAERAISRNRNNDAKWSDAYAKHTKTAYQLLRSKPISYEGAGTLVTFVAQGLSIAGYKSTVERLNEQAETLRRGKLKDNVWIWLKYADLLLTKNMPKSPELRIFRRAIRSVLRFVQSKGGKVDQRRLSIWPVWTGESSCPAYPLLTGRVLTFIPAEPEG
jgi:hypothetical protein